MVMNPESVKKGVQGIKNYLTYKKVLQTNELLLTKDIKLITRNRINSYYAPTGGMIQSRLPLATKVSAGDCIYQILSFNKQQKNPKLIDICAENNGLVFDVSTNQCVNQGEYVMDILEC
jgi:predicted deacylase